MDIREALEKIIDAVTKEKGAKKELEGMFEELVGEIDDVIQDQLFNNVRYVVIDRLINTSAIQEMDNSQINQLITDISILISLNVADGYIKRIADAVKVDKPDKKEPEIGYA
jgi:hypothetical protein